MCPSGAGYFGGSDKSHTPRQGSGNRGPDVFAGVFEKTGKDSMTRFICWATRINRRRSCRRCLLNAQENLNIVDVRGYEEFEYQPQRLMNAMNEAAPKVIFSRMTYPLDLELMHSGRKFLNAELWVALPETKLKEKVRTTFWRKVRKKIFQKKVNEYNLEKAEQ